MLGRLILAAALVAGLYLLVRWLVRTPPERVTRLLKKAAVWGGLALIIVLAATGRLPWLLAVVTAGLAVVMRVVNVLQLIPLLRQVAASLGLGGAASGAGAGQPRTSSIRTRFVEMSLDHRSGGMDGLVLEGPMQGRRLSELTEPELLDLLRLCRGQDGQSAAVLEAYLDRTHEGWRDRGGPHPEGGTPADASGPMGREEAAAILGVAEDASETEIRDAHRRLMQKLHPDRGGSTYLAAKINQAKDVLLGR